jgi:hypothetical protein
MTWPTGTTHKTTDASWIERLSKKFEKEQKQAADLEHVRAYIESSAPCSLFSIGVWVEDQLNVTTVELLGILNTLASAGTIELSSDESGIIVDLI